MALLCAALLTVSGCTDTCLLNGECPGATVCLEGSCRTPCLVDTECPVDLYCLGGGCRALAPGERPPCRDDGGCAEADMQVSVDAALDAEGGPDAVVGPDGALDAGPRLDGAVLDGALPDGLLTDGGPLDGGLPDGAMLDGGLPDGTPDGAMLDGGLLDGAFFDGSADAMRAPVDGGVAIDLTGLYAVTTVVVVATGGELSEGDEQRHIHRLEWLGGTRHRLEVYATDGVFEHAALIDLASPDGPGRYQFEYARAAPAPEGCEGTEVRFQRGRFEVFQPGYRLLAGEERTVVFDGADCAVEGYLVRVEAEWIPLPPP